MVAARAALGNACGLVLLGLSLLLAAASVALPGRAAWSDRAAWLVACGLLAYGISVGLVAWTSPRRRTPPEADEVREVRRVRDRLVDLLRSEERRGHATPPALVRTLAETIAQCDEHLLPTLRHLVTRHDALAATLAQYAHGELPAPDTDVQERLRAVEVRQRAAIAACVRQAVNAEAALLAILHEDLDSDTLAGEVHAWTTRLLDLHEALQELLHGQG
jgi:hypothetical protein